MVKNFGEPGHEQEPVQGAASREYEEAMAGAPVPEWKPAKPVETVSLAEDEVHWAAAFEAGNNA